MKICAVSIELIHTKIACEAVSQSRMFVPLIYAVRGAVTHVMTKVGSVVIMMRKLGCFAVVCL